MQEIDTDGCILYDNDDIQRLIYRRFIMATSTPWGPSQYADKLARGVTMYGTAGHGGIKVSDKLNREIPPEFRNESGWYEEDCEAVIPLYFLKERLLDYYDQGKSDMEGSWLKKWTDINNSFGSLSYMKTQIAAALDNEDFVKKYPDFATCVKENIVERHNDGLVWNQGVDARLKSFYVAKAKHEVSLADSEYLLMFEPIKFVGGYEVQLIKRDVGSRGKVTLKSTEYGFRIKNSTLYSSSNYIHLDKASLLELGSIKAWKEPAQEVGGIGI